MSDNALIVSFTAALIAIPLFFLALARVCSPTDCAKSCGDAGMAKVTMTSCQCKP